MQAVFGRPSRRKRTKGRKEQGMAIYEFECIGCGEHFEVTRPIHEHDELMQHTPTCPKCGKGETREVAPLIGYKTPSS
jgi:putative FmdB family regulatory protein